MASSPPFEMEDQTDEDFFDRLVDDDDDGINCNGSGPSPVKADDSVMGKAFSDLSISDVGPTRADSIGDFSFSVEESEAGEGGIVLAGLKDSAGAVVVPESNAVIPSGVNKSEEGALDVCAKDNSSIGTGTGPKEVHWSSFDSDSNVDGGSGFRSYSHLFNDLGDDSGDPFANLGHTDNSPAEFGSKIGVSENPIPVTGSSNNQDVQNHAQNLEDNVDQQDLNSRQYWEDLYPGWRYDPNTGLWHQLDGHGADLATTRNDNSVQTVDVNAQSGRVSEKSSDVYHLEQTTQSESILGSVAEAATDATISNWKQISSGNDEYPAHMVFDPQYPGWYYDTIVQEWRLLESYSPAANPSTTSAYDQQFQSTDVDNYGSHVHGSQDSAMSWGGSVHDYNQKDTSMWQTESVDKSENTGFIDNNQLDDLFGSAGRVNTFGEQLTGFRPSGLVSPFEQASQSAGSSNEVSMFQNFVPFQQFSQHHYQTKMVPDHHMHFKPAYFDSQTSVSFAKQQLQSGSQFSYAPSEGRSSAGRPPHALVTFGFGGKLVVLKNDGSHGSKDSLGGVVNVLNLMELVMEKTAASSFGLDACDYFHVLCRQSFPGPLVGGNVGNKELNKWLEERIADCESSNIDYRNGEVMRLLFSLLKIACHYYGKLRSPFVADPALNESDSPELAVAKLFGSSKRNDAQMGEYAAMVHCLQKLPSEVQIQATALEVQKLLVSGRKEEALERAKEGYLWGPALVLATQLGDQFYGDTVKQMALKQLVAGSPLQTLCLLIAGQPADVFSNDTSSSIIPGSVNTFQQPLQSGANCTLDKWEENLAIIIANRTKGDELVVIHLGDCLWKERGEVAAAHVCYLVAESNFEPYSDNARLCLVGADHWKFPRTYASPQAIQRTELYEYAKVLGNSQFLLHPFQPYKLIYAHMLAEVGKVADSLKYCQAMLKSLKTGRGPEVDSSKQLVLSLEERLRIHQESGYTTNLTATKLVGKLLTFFDSTSNRVAGSLPPSGPLKSNSPVLPNEFAHQPVGSKVPNNQSTIATPFFTPSASVEPISEWTGKTNQPSAPNRSISEPDFGRSPAKTDSSKEADKSVTQEQESMSSKSSRFGRFGAQLFQKTVGLVLRARPDKQAKLGEKNKFYYDEKLKRWVEEGAEPLAEEPVLAPPPTLAAFQNVAPNSNENDAPNFGSFHISSEPGTHTPITSDRSSGIPPIPPSSNQFSARGRTGVRSRYVDTFNKSGGTPANLFQSPPIPSFKPGGGSNPKFFIPSPVAPAEEMAQATGAIIQESHVKNGSAPTSFKSSFSPTPTSAPTSESASSAVIMQRFPSMDNIINKRSGVMADGDNSFVTHSRRAASWSGSLGDATGPVKMETRPYGEAQGLATTSVSADPPNQFSDSSNFGGALHEVDF
ncbi:Protein transport protein sec16 [Melia azedarach]|uniref:Protein transport protein sec16 n=2 Tax=Melia azedarach TaxID=155640 RepID=A0ACC1YUH7_MELAZ|nr:Protein transport protein sec16 [Melia azedarach]KAJ4727189.1 Protein transport protein sec16 [Melia azedarach]